MSDNSNTQTERPSLDAIMEGLAVPPPAELVRGVTVWMGKEYKAKYDHVQSVTRRQFASILRAVVQEAIEKAWLKVG